MCCKARNLEMGNQWGPEMENGYVRIQTCERCLAGIQTSLQNMKDGQDEIKELISSDKKEAARRQILWVAIASLIVGLLSNHTK
ncbi:MAG: hypothetical protein ACYTEW_27120 [Planctomycetota bacterium]